MSSAVFFIPRNGRSTSRRAQPYNGRSSHVARGGRLSSRKLINMKNHVAVMVTTVLSCLILSSYLVYDLVMIYRFFSDLNARMRENSTPEIAERNASSTASTTQLDYSLLLETANTYHRQRALAAALLVLLFLQAVASIGVYLALEKKNRFLLVGFLILTFPVMTFAMVYAIVFMVDTATTFVYVKIVSVILVYTIEANLYRLVYRMYQLLKFEERRGRARGNGETNDGFSQDRQPQDQPLVIQLKPPPYEKEPPPYSEQSPIASVHLNQSPAVPTVTCNSRNSLSYGIGCSNPSASSVFDFSPDSVLELSYNSTSSNSTANLPNRLTPLSPTSSVSLSSYHHQPADVTPGDDVTELSSDTPPYSVSVEPHITYIRDPGLHQEGEDPPPPYTET